MSVTHVNTKYGNVCGSPVYSVTLDGDEPEFVTLSGSGLTIDPQELYHEGDHEVDVTIQLQGTTSSTTFSVDVTVLPCFLNVLKIKGTKRRYEYRI